MAEDLRMVASGTLTLGLGLISNFVSLFTFSAIVWGLSGALAITLGGQTLQVPGYMLWVAFIYALGGSWAIEKIGGRMVQIDYRQQQAEADFRAALLRIRESAEQIALYGGESAERARLSARFAAVRRNWRDIMNYTKRITIADNAYTEVGALVPYMLQCPRLFKGIITLGDLTQLIQSFMRVRVALSWFIYKYKDLALLRSALAVLMDFTPRELDLAQVRSHMLGIDHVEEVHDLHAWTVASGMPVLTAHVVVRDECLSDGHTEEILDRLQSCVAEHFPVRIQHATLQLEPVSHLEHEAAYC